MDSRIKHKIVAGAAGVALVAGSGIAYASSTSTTSASPSTTSTTGTTTTGPAASRDTYLDALATRLGISRTALDAALKGAGDDQLAQAVKDGKLTQAQADAIKARGGTGPGFGGFGGFGHGGPGGPGRGGPGPGFGGPGAGGPGGHFGGGLAGVFGNELSAAATYLGLSTDALETQLKAGKSLSDIATAQSKDVAGLKAAIVAAATKDLTSAVDAIVAGKLPSGPAPLKRGAKHPGRHA